MNDQGGLFQEPPTPQQAPPTPSGRRPRTDLDRNLDYLNRVAKHTGRAVHESPRIGPGGEWYVPVPDNNICFVYRPDCSYDRQIPMAEFKELGLEDVNGTNGR
jgi:hypothetical protein